MDFKILIPFKNNWQIDKTKRTRIICVTPNGNETPSKFAINLAIASCYGWHTMLEYNKKWPAIIIAHESKLKSNLIHAWSRIEKNAFFWQHTPSSHFQWWIHHTPNDIIFQQISSFEHSYSTYTEFNVRAQWNLKFRANAWCVRAVSCAHNHFSFENVEKKNHCVSSIIIQRTPDRYLRPTMWTMPMTAPFSKSSLFLQYR